MNLSIDGTQMGAGDPGFAEPGGPGAVDEEPPPGTIVRPEDETVVDEEVCQFIDPGDAPLRRLTGDAYHASVRDLFPGVTIPTQSFSPDERIANFEANTVAKVTILLAEEYQRAAEEISAIVVPTLSETLPADADEATVRSFITDLGTRAFRRRVDEAEVTALYELYNTGRTQIDGDTGARMVIEAILQSPMFLYRLEEGEEGTGDVVPLNDFAIASRLSYFLWGTTPDQTLLDAATQGQLSTREEVEAHARRMLEDPRARARINGAFEEWMRIDELAEVEKPDPAFDEAMKASMIAETEAFIDHVIWETDGSITDLLTANYTFVDANTAAVYGVSAGDSADGLVRVDLPADRRGILSQPGVLAAHGHGQMPIHRGKFVRDAFFCSAPPPPPDTIVPLETYEGESMRSKAEKRMAARTEGCAGCHLQMDGLGLVFDMYDEMGRYRTEDEFGNALSSAGAILKTSGYPGFT